MSTPPPPWPPVPYGGWYPAPPPRPGMPGWAWFLIGAVMGGVLGAVVGFVGLVLVGIATGPPTGAGSAQLAYLSEQCGDGEMLACDLLYQVSPVGSEEEAYGLTCGGRGGRDSGFCTDELAEIGGDGPDPLNTAS